MATCDDIVGLWKFSIISFDPPVGQEDGEVEEDGSIRIFKDAAGNLQGEHIKTGSTTPLTVSCRANNRGVRIELTEVVGQTTTVYKGRAVFFVLKDALVIVKGRVQRRTPNGRRTVDNGDGDWSSEKPT